MQEDEKLAPASEVRCLSKQNKIDQQNAPEVDDVPASPETVRPPRWSRRLLAKDHSDEQSEQGLIACVEVPEPKDLGVE